VALGTAAILWVSVRAVQAGTMTAGDLILVTAHVAQLYGPIQTIAGYVSNQQSALASVERSFAVLDREPTVRERPGAAPMGRARGAVEFRDVAFGYGPGRPVVRDVSFRVPAGSWVSISGPSGTGKSTLTNLLVRFLDPEQGSIRLDGRDLRDIRLADLRRQFALLGQDGHLVAGTVEENIAFACPGAGREAVERAARLAQADGFVSALPEGYGTVVGGPGCHLSGGQRQRVALARALLRDAPVVVLDEPTSALDEDTERAVIAELRRSLAGRTVFVVTHRPSVLAVADLVLHLRGGTVVVGDQCEAEPPERLAA
jgi:ABC-type multidrug transport system fused ATPase/permease subunit